MRNRRNGVIARIRLAAFMAAALSIGANASAQILPPDEGQRSPCSGQPQTLNALKKRFDSAGVPPAAEMTGTWVAIGFFSGASNNRQELVSVNCSGVTRDNGFEAVMYAEGYSVQPFIIGVAHTAVRDVEIDTTRRMTFLLDFGSGADVRSHCRLTTQHTLACVFDRDDEAIEFKKMSATRDERILPPWFGGNRLPPSYFATPEDDKLLLVVGRRLLKDGAEPSCVSYTSDTEFVGIDAVSPWLLNRLRRYRPRLVNCDDNTPITTEILYLGPVGWITRPTDAHVYYGGFGGMVGRASYWAHRGVFGRWRLTPMVRE